MNSISKGREQHIDRFIVHRHLYHPCYLQLAPLFLLCILMQRRPPAACSWSHGAMYSQMHHAPMRAPSLLGPSYPYLRSCNYVLLLLSKKKCPTPMCSICSCSTDICACLYLLFLFHTHPATSRCFREHVKVDQMHSFLF